MRRYSKWSRRAKVIGGVSALALLATSGALAFVTATPSTVTVSTTGDSPYAASDVTDNGTALAPGSTVPIVIRVHNPMDVAISITSLDSGRSVELGAVGEPDYCPEGSIKTDMQLPPAGETYLTFIEGSTSIPAGEQRTYSSMATFDVASYSNEAEPAQNQDGCLPLSHEVPVTVNWVQTP